MEYTESTQCRGCLSIDRSVKLLPGSIKTCFLQILFEVSGSPIEEEEVSLCWECRAHVSRIVRFKQSVREADREFSGILAVNKSKSSLQHHTLPSLSYDPDQTEIKDEVFEIVLPETIESDRSDNEFLIDLSVRTKKEGKKKKVKKKKKKLEKDVIGGPETNIYTEILLDSDGISKERELMLLKDHYVNSIFKCNDCIVTFPNAEDMKEHEANKHSLNTPYKCAICQCHFNTEVSHNYHTNRHKRRFKCNICMENFVSRRDVTKHYNEIHCYGVNLNYKKDLGDLTNGDKKNGESENCTSEAQFGCEFCSKRFKWKTSLRKHLETHRIESGLKRKPYCETCRLTFTTTSNLQKHVKTSSKHQIELKLRKLKDLPTEHQKSIEQIKKEVNQGATLYRCETCGRTFQWRGNLLRHLTSHLARAKGELVCKPCNRSFSSIATYKQHLKISKKHVSENDFKYMCSECGRRFFNRTRLKEHVANVHERTCSANKPNKIANTLALCHYCGKQAASPAKLRAHIVSVHSGGAPYACALCHTMFSWHSCLSRHYRRAHRGRGEIGDIAVRRTPARSATPCSAGTPV